MNPLLDRVCIIGAGASGIAACKVLKERKIPFDCYEMSNRVGGLWVYNNANGLSSAYRSLHINTSKKLMQYSDYPLPEEYPNFPHHSQIAQYFDDYAEHFGLKPHIHFQTKVVQAEPLEFAGWQITLDDQSCHNYRALIVANGHHWNPRWPNPSFPGEFEGKQTHSHYYKSAEIYQDKNVVVVGFGNSAMDIAVEVSRIARNTYLSVRRGFHIIPKHVLGTPLDLAPIPRFLPFSWKLKIQAFAVKLQVGKLSQYGLPDPDHPYMHAHPTISSDIFSALSHGRVKPKPNIQKLNGDGVIFVDGSREKVDEIIYCTGYNVSFPFFRPEVIEVKNNEVQLFHHVFHPHYRDLFFIGLLQPIGPVMPIAELQSQWISQYLLGEYKLPDSTTMKREIFREKEQVRQRYGYSARHTMQVDYEPYIASVKKEMKKGSGEALPLIQSEPNSLLPTHIVSTIS
jgi:dimethylaniline monooxygenase (N-oxide forming)